MFEGKVIALTGAGSGIGLETEKLLAARGARLTICDANAEALSKAADLIDEMAPARNSIPRTQRPKTAVVDVTNRAQVDAWINETVSDFGKLDGAANIAGITDGGKFVEEMCSSDWDKTIAVTLTGVMLCMRAQIPQTEAQRLNRQRVELGRKSRIWHGLSLRGFQSSV